MRLLSIISVFLLLGLVSAQNLAWPPVLGSKQIWKVSIPGIADFQVTLGAKNQRGFVAQAVFNQQIFNAEVFYRPTEDTLEIKISPTPGVHACTFTSARTVKGLSFVGAAYYLPPNATTYQNLQRKCEMSYIDPNLGGAPVPSLGGAPVPSLGGAPVPSLGGAPVSTESLKSIIATQSSPSASANSVISGRSWNPTFNIGQTWDVVFDGLGTWAVNLFATSENLPYGYAVGADTRVGLGGYFTKEQVQLDTDLALFIVASQTEYLVCILLPSGAQANNTWQGIGAVQPAGKELVATGRGCNVRLRPIVLNLKALFTLINF